MTLLTALLIILRTAAKITHKAQGVTSLAAKWHICATIESFESGDTETPTLQVTASRLFPNVGSESDAEDAGDEEDELDNNKLIPAYAQSTISFQKRQALGKQTTILLNCLKVIFLMLCTHLISALYQVKLTTLLSGGSDIL